MNNHFHCKECGKIIEETNAGDAIVAASGATLFVLKIKAERLKVCKDCIIDAGVKYYEKKSKKEKK